MVTFVTFLKKEKPEMQWYLFICGIICFVYIILNQPYARGNSKSAVLFFSFLILFVFASLRADQVGADTRQYLALLNQLRAMDFSEMLQGRLYSAGYGYYVSWEFGFRLLMYAYVKVFYFLPVRTGLGFIALLIMLFLYNAIKDQSAHSFLSIWLYITLAFFQTGMNMAQNALSIAMVLWALKFIKEERPLKWSIMVLLATGIHLSSIIFLPMYWISRMKFTNRGIKISVLLMAIIALFSNRIISAMGYIIPVAYKSYLNRSESASSQLLVLALHSALVFPVLLFSNENGLDLSKFRINTKSIIVKPYFHFFVLEISFYILALRSSGFLRAATVFSPVLVIYVPNIIANLPNKRIENRMVIYSAIVSFAGYVVRMMVNNIGLTIPYMFYWQM